MPPRRRSRSDLRVIVAVVGLILLALTLVFDRESDAGGIVYPLLGLTFLVAIALALAELRPRGR